MKENYNKILSSEMKERLRNIKHLALDMDGTIYMENNIFPFTLEFLSNLEKAGVGYSFLTNNPTKSVADYLGKLKKMGIQANEDNMYTTSIAAIDYIKEHYPDARRLFMLGTQSMIEQFEKAGFESCSDSPDDVPDVLVVAFDLSLTYSRLCRASWWASQNIPYIATNPDKVCPTDQRTVLVDCGSLQKCIEFATDRKPDIVLGKPDPNMLEGICRRHNLKSHEIGMVGDRYYTDLELAHNADAVGVLVLSGETTLEQAEKVTRKGDFIVRDIKELGEMILESKQ